LKKVHLLAARNEKKIVPNDNTKVWIKEDEVQLDRLNNKIIKMRHIEVGEQTGEVLDDAIAVLSICSQE